MPKPSDHEADARRCSVMTPGSSPRRGGLRGCARPCDRPTARSVAPPAARSRAPRRPRPGSRATLSLHQTVRALGAGDRALGRRSHGQARHAEERGLLLQAARVGDDQGGLVHEREGIEVGDRIQQAQRPRPPGPPNPCRGSARGSGGAPGRPPAVSQPRLASVSSSSRRVSGASTLFGRCSVTKT